VSTFIDVYLGNSTWFMVTCPEVHLSGGSLVRRFKGYPTNPNPNPNPNPNLT